MASEITLGTLVPFSARRFSPSASRLFGKQVAHEELLQQLLLGGAVAGIDVFASSMLKRVADRERYQCELALDEAFPPPGPRPRFTPLTMLPSAIARDDYCFITSGPESQRLGQMRWQADRHRCMIITLIHAVGWVDLMPGYFGLARTLEAADAVVVTSAAAEAALSEILAWIQETCGATLRARLERIPLGTDVASADAFSREASRKALSIPLDQQVVLFVGRLTDEYKADLAPLIGVTAALSATYPKLRLILAGHNQDGYADRLRRLAREAGAGQLLTCVENPPDVVKHLLYATADVFVSPSDNVQESFGLSLLEAMAHGLPVICSDWSGYRDIVRDGESGFLVPTRMDPAASDVASTLTPVDLTYGIPHYLASHTVVDVECLSTRLETLLGNADLRRAMGRAARRTVESRFAWPVIVDQYRSLFAAQCQSARDDRANGARLLNVGEVFRRYPTAHFDDDTRVECTDRGRQLLQELSATPLAGDGAVMAGVLTTASTPAPWSTWAADRGAARDAVLALLKSGALRATSVRGSAKNTLP